MATTKGETECPLCDFKSTTGEYELMLHVETFHAEDESPFVGSTGDDNEQLTSHSGHGPDEQPRNSPAMKEAEEVESDRKEKSRSRQKKHHAHTPGDAAKSSASTARRSKPTGSNSQPGVVEAWKKLFGGYKQQDSPRSPRRRHREKGDNGDRRRHEISAGEPRRRSRSPSKEDNEDENRELLKLGKSELGRHADEKKMPRWLVDLLTTDGEVCSKHIIPVLQQLLEQSPSTEYALMCSPHVTHVSKLRREGSFCGYRNIQMLISHIILARLKGSELFSDTFPTIFEIQDLIENAWDAGFNAQGRTETGGIKGTRKYIGTPEAKALFESLGILCPVQAFKDHDQERARNMLLQAVEMYFWQGLVKGDTKVHSTNLPPIYFQHRGHSMTIVGIEKRKNGHTNLLVFDPSYRDSSTVKGLVGRRFKHPVGKVDSVLNPYRRGSKYLRKYGEFEVLYLANIPSSS